MEETKKTLTKKQKIIIAVIVAVVVVAGAVTAAILLQNPLKLKKEEITVEFGQPISTEASTYLKKDVDKNIVKDTKVSYKAKPVEGQTYDQVGEYTVKLIYENKEADVKVIVEDTTAPEFNATADAGIDTIEGVELDLNKLITATDLSGAEVTLDTEGLDLNKAGSYTITAKAVDKFKNETEKKIAVTVAEKPANMTGSSVTVDPATGKVSVTAKTYTPKASSSSSSSGSKSYSSSKGSSSSSSGSSSSGGSWSGIEPGSSGTIAGSGHTWEAGDVFDWPDEWN